MSFIPLIKSKKHACGRASLCAESTAFGGILNQKGELIDRSAAGKLYLNGTPEKRITAVTVSNRYIAQPDRSSTDRGQDIGGELCVVKQASASGCGAV
jgi:hypothetical protein